MRSAPKYITIWLALFWGLAIGHIQAQQVVWEKAWGFPNTGEEIEAMCPASDATYFALGKTVQWGQFVGNGYYFETVIIKFDENGDTLFIKRFHILCAYIYYLGHKFGNVYQAVFDTPILIGTNDFRIPVLVEFDLDGNVLATKYFNQPENFSIRSCISTPDFGLIMTGYGHNGIQTCLSALKLNFMREVEWVNYYMPPVQINGFGQQVEAMPNNHYQISGRLGKRIYGFEFDSAGAYIAQKEFYQTPTNYVFRYGAARQGFDKGSFVYGKFADATNTVGYFGRHDSLGNKIWGGETPVTTVNALIVNRENSILVAKNGYECSLERLTKDSVTLWKLLLSVNTEQKTKFASNLIFTQPDTGIVYGYYFQQTGGLGNQFWYAKVAGVGTPYDPTHPEDTVTVSAQEKLFRPKDSPILYPNPTTETIRFTKLTQETQVSIYSSKGEKLMEKWIKPDEVLDVWALPVGAYLYHLKMGERVFTGKLLKK